MYVTPNNPLKPYNNLISMWNWFMCKRRRNIVLEQNFLCENGDVTNKITKMRKQSRNRFQNTRARQKERWIPCWRLLRENFEIDTLVLIYFLNVRSFMRNAKVDASKAEISLRLLHFFKWHSHVQPTVFSQCLELRLGLMTKLENS